MDTVQGAEAVPLVATVPAAIAAWMDARAQAFG
jgi:hypothetical protein